MLAATAPYGAIAACGLAGGAELSTTVFPFILRNVALLGINSVLTPRPLSIEAWRRLALELPLDKAQAALKELEQVRAVLEAEGREHANAKKPSTSKDR